MEKTNPYKVKVLGKTLKILDLTSWFSIMVKLSILINGKGKRPSVSFLKLDGGFRLTAQEWEKSSPGRVNFLMLGN